MVSKLTETFSKTPCVTLHIRYAHTSFFNTCSTCTSELGMLEVFV